MVARNKTVSELVLVKERQNLIETGGLAPVAHQVADDTEQAHESDASLLHAAVRILRKADVEGTAGIGVGEHFVASVDEGKSQERGACVVNNCLIIQMRVSRDERTYKLQSQYQR